MYVGWFPSKFRDYPAAAGVHLAGAAPKVLWLRSRRIVAPSSRTALLSRKQNQRASYPRKPHSGGSFTKQCWPTRRTSATSLTSITASPFSRKAISAGTNIETHYKTSETIFGFAGELRQVFANLIGNALEAGATGIKIRVSPGQDWKHQARPGVRVTVADHGSGIPADSAGKLFEPFFTTRDEKGTGLGLWVSKGIVQKHEGWMRMPPAPNQPATAPPSSSSRLPCKRAPITVPAAYSSRSLTGGVPKEIHSGVAALTCRSIRVPRSMAIRIAALPSDRAVLLFSLESNMPEHRFPATIKPCTPRSPDRRVSLRAITVPRRLARATG